MGQTLWRSCTGSKSGPFSLPVIQTSLCLTSKPPSILFTPSSLPHVTLPYLLCSLTSFCPEISRLVLLDTYVTGVPRPESSSPTSPPLADKYFTAPFTPVDLSSEASKTLRPTRIPYEESSVYSKASCGIPAKRLQLHVTHVLLSLGSSQPKR